VRESGTHQELLAQRGIYFKLFELQYQAGGARLAAPTLTGKQSPDADEKGAVPARGA
jgi:hypothetical protein